MVVMGRKMRRPIMTTTVEEKKDADGHVFRLRAAHAHMRDGTFCPNLRAIVPPREKKKSEQPIDGFVTSTSVKLRLIAVTPQPVNVVAEAKRVPLLVVVDNTALPECRCMVRCDRNVSLPYVAGLDPNVVKEDTGYLAH